MYTYIHATVLPGPPYFAARLIDRAQRSSSCP